MNHFLISTCYTILGFWKRSMGRAEQCVRCRPHVAEDGRFIITVRFEGGWRVRRPRG